MVELDSYYLPGITNSLEGYFSCKLNNYCYWNAGWNLQSGYKYKRWI